MRGRHVPPLTESEAADIVSRYGRGQSLKFIEFAVGRSRPVITAALAARGVKVRRPGKSASGQWGWRGG